jgi:hypothetical protein
VFRQSAGCHHVEVKVKDVILPFVILFAANFAVLLAWTLVAPLRWTRVEVANFDHFGRIVESYGTCFAPAGKDGRMLLLASSSNAFMLLLGLFNLVAVAFANYQCYLSRQVPSDFNESYYIGLSMLSILEGFLIGIPILFLAVGNPTANFIVASLLISFLCLAMLVPTFIPKVFVKNHTRLRRSEWREAWRNYDRCISRDGHQTQAASLRGRGDGNVTSSRATAASGRTTAASSGNQSSVAAIRARVAQSAVQESGRQRTLQESQRVKNRHRIRKT